MELRAGADSVVLPGDVVGSIGAASEGLRFGAGLRQRQAQTAAVA